MIYGIYTVTIYDFYHNFNMNILLPDSWLRKYLETKATSQQLMDCLSLCGPSFERMNSSADDVVYDIEITSNRVDMASVYGIAREAAAILPQFKIGAKIKDIELATYEKPQNLLPMSVSDPEKICNRIMGIVMTVEKMKDSPSLMKNRLEKSGVRSLNNLVDITNYVMLETGHPCHVFDYDRIKTHTFLIRCAKKNEPITTLDEKKYHLSEEDVIIDDGTGRVIDLPGIMGTQNSIVTKDTKRIFFFIESNDPVRIRKTSMRYGIRTMAATLNEKHPDPNLVKIALMRGIKLFQDEAGGQISGELIDIYPNPTQSRNITITSDFINSRLGIVLKPSEIQNILTSLNFQIRSSNDKEMEVTPPSYRQFDVSIKEDIVEEIARIYGYHNLPSVLMQGAIPLTQKPIDIPIEEKMKTILKYWGYTEIYNYSFISKQLIQKAALSQTDHIKVANPLTSDIEYMRTTLIPSVLQTVFENQKVSEKLDLFELSKTYQRPQKKDQLPQEESSLVIVSQNSLRHVKGIIFSLLEEFGIVDVVQILQKSWRFGHPKQTVQLVSEVNNSELAFIGLLHPSLQSAFGITKPIYLAQVYIPNSLKLYNPNKKYVPIPNFPPCFENLSLITPVSMHYADMENVIKETSSFVEQVNLLEEYNNSITVSLRFQSRNHTLTKDELKQQREKILQNLDRKLGIKLKL
jgi:phenylalanyl-tRNA synthetase beta chain